MKIQWHGHSCFEVSNEDVRIVIDPHDGKSIGIKPPRTTADIVLMTHSHYDHNAANVIFGNHENFLQKEGKFDCRGISFEGFPSFHDSEMGALRGTNTIYRFELDGMTICHVGDLGDMPSDEVMSKISGVDFLFVPIGEVYTMELPKIKKFIERMKAKVTIPMHYRVGGLTISISSIDGFMELVPNDNIRYVGNVIDVMKEEMPDTHECWVFDRNF